MPCPSSVRSRLISNLPHYGLPAVVPRYRIDLAPPPSRLEPRYTFGPTGQLPDRGLTGRLRDMVTICCLPTHCTRRAGSLGTWKSAVKARGLEKRPFRIRQPTSDMHAIRAV